MSHVRSLIFMKFKAIVIDNQNEKFTREVKEIDKETHKAMFCEGRLFQPQLQRCYDLKGWGRIVRKFPLFLAWTRELLLKAVTTNSKKTTT